MAKELSGRARLAVCGIVLAVSFAVTYAGYSAATQFGDGDNCGPGTNGTSGGDIYYMGGGNDCAHMFGSGDFLDGQGGNDSPLDGDDGGDWVVGGAGSDEVRGSHGADLLDGQDDGDHVIDHNGIDTLRGSENGDFVNGNDGAGGDTVNGGAGVNDFCSWDGGLDDPNDCEARY